ncbi:MAG TPA: hypothetical protein VL588_04140 [Bdellovibrionota bacterium]|nr:hypothetical protein [Bdellovibrionota bacterium]
MVQNSLKSVLVIAGALALGGAARADEPSADYTPDPALAGLGANHSDLYVAPASAEVATGLCELTADMNRQAFYVAWTSVLTDQKVATAAQQIERFQKRLDRRLRAQIAAHRAGKGNRIALWGDLTKLTLQPEESSDRGRIFAEVGADGDVSLLISNDGHEIRLPLHGDEIDASVLKARLREHVAREVSHQLGSILPTDDVSTYVKWFSGMPEECFKAPQGPGDVASSEGDTAADPAPATIGEVADAGSSDRGR